MPSERELHDLARNAAAVRALARSLVAKTADFSEFEADFLGDKTSWSDDRTLSHRQAEVLLEIRDDYQLVSDYRGISVARIISECWLSRDAFEDRDIAFLRTLLGKTQILRKFLWRLLRCAREVGALESYM